MKNVNLIYYNNGVGLTKDAKIIETALSDFFKFNHQNAFENNYFNADINIFLQNIDTHTINFLKTSKINILIPNLEWMPKFGLDNIYKFNLILVKSKEAQSILSNYHSQVNYIGFASEDKFIQTVEKSKKFIHFPGKSIQKYTELIIDVFNELQLPITVVDSTQRFLKKITPNINYITDYLSEEEVNILFNSHKIHICCSLSEGWGHYIYEALSCKSVVVINDCPPENEFLMDGEAFKVKTTDIYQTKPIDFLTDQQYPLRKIHYTDKNDFIENIKKLDSLSDLKIKEIGENSRIKFLGIKNKFYDKIKVVFQSFL